MKKLIPFFILLLTAALAQAEDASAIPQLRDSFNKADAVLNTVYKETLAELDKTQTAALKKKEAAWVEFREGKAESMAKIAAGEKAGKPELSGVYWQTMISYTQQRAEFLKVYSGKNLLLELTGDYTDSLDGDLELEDKPDGLFFTFSVVRGSAAHTGQISGIIQRKGDKAHFKGEKVEGSKAAPCELNFTFIDGHIVRVEEVSPDPEAGAGVHYGGDYYKKADSVIHD